jgi:hypothetical protein
MKLGKSHRQNNTKIKFYMAWNQIFLLRASVKLLKTSTGSSEVFLLQKEIIMLMVSTQK